MHDDCSKGCGAAQSPLRILLVGEREEDFFLVREILESNRSALATELEHARSLDERGHCCNKNPTELSCLSMQREMSSRCNLSPSSCTRAY